MKLASKFGHTMPALRYMASEFWPLPYCRAGLEWEWEHAAQLQVNMAGSRSTRLVGKTDGSLRDHGWEVVTQGDGLFGVDLHDAMSEMHELAVKTNVQTTYRCAFHCHIDIRDMDPEEVHNMLFLYVLLEQPLFEWVGDDRANNNFCVPWYRAEGIVEVLRKLQNPDMQTIGKIKTMPRYAALNIQSIAKYGTVEFRHLQNHVYEVLTKQVAFVKFAMLLKKLAIRLGNENITGIKTYEWAKAGTYQDLLLNLGFDLPPHPDFPEAIMFASAMIPFEARKMTDFIDNLYLPFFGTHPNWR